MTKPYRPRNPYSKSAYSKRRRFEENERIKQEMHKNGLWTDQDEDNSKTFAVILFIIICVIMFLILGPENFAKWAS
jgi:hypothetical protein